MLAKIGELVRRIEGVPSSLREQDLPAAAGLRDPRRLMDVQAVVRAVAHRRLPRVKAHADTQLDSLRPGMSGERLLGLRNCLGCPAGVLEDDEELVAAMVDDLSCAALHRLAEETPVIREHRRVAVAKLADKLRGALDICEDECDRSMGEIWGQSLLQRDLGPNTGSRARGTVDRKLAV